MNSVMEQIREARKNDSRIDAKSDELETTVNGCSVKMRFAAVANAQAITRSCDMLLTAFFDTSRTAVSEGAANG